MPDIVQCYTPILECIPSAPSHQFELFSDFIVNISEIEQDKLSSESVLFDDDVKPSSDDGSLKKMSAHLDFEPAVTTLTDTNLSHDDDDIRLFEEPIVNTEVLDEPMDTPK